jgi:DNA-binding HxlR family transcriptional regulator
MPASGYGQFCPVAKASEIFAERWTPLILRELLLGSRRFNELEAGLPRISHSLLTHRLRTLEQAGLVQRHVTDTGRTSEYVLTQAGQELWDVVEALGSWGQKWVNHEITDTDIDPDLLIWDMHRRIDMRQIPNRQIVIQFDFTGQATKRYWLVVRPAEVSVCVTYPGFEPDVLVTADTLALHQVWVGHLTFADALRSGRIVLDGPRALTRALPGWFQLSMFAHIPSAQAASPRA